MQFYDEFWIAEKGSTLTRNYNTNVGCRRDAMQCASKIRKTHALQKRVNNSLIMSPTPYAFIILNFQLFIPLPKLSLNIEK